VVGRRHLAGSGSGVQPPCRGPGIT
jgi:hypothetical protein